MSHKDPYSAYTVSPSSIGAAKEGMPGILVASPGAVVVRKAATKEEELAILAAATGVTVVQKSEPANNVIDCMGCHLPGKNSYKVSVLPPGIKVSVLELLDGRRPLNCTRLDGLVPSVASS